MITICADDFGQNEKISIGIINLLKEKKINATSCMTNMPYWPQAAQRLLAANVDAKVGLHFNLTHGKALTRDCKAYFSDLKPLIFNVFSMKLDERIIANELRAQIKAFKKEMHRLPDFIDGHQHIHHLPIIRDALLDVYQEFYPERNALIRVAMPSLKQIFRCPKALIIKLTGAKRLKKMLEANNIPHNKHFSGVYNLSPKANYAKLFPKFLKDIKGDGLIMCHPGLASNDAKDPIAAARSNEYQYLIAQQDSIIFL